MDPRAEADFTLARCQAMFQAAPFVADLGIEATAVSAGECHSALVLAHRHLQHTGVVHAGVLTTMADHTAGAAAQSTVAPGGTILTAELKVSLLRAARGQALRCVARVLKPGRQLVFTEAEVYCRDGDKESLVVKLSATMAVLAKPLPV
jgi:uncharacterized protein (TIGR00369 family)